VARIDSTWRAVREFTAIARREAEAVESRTVAGVADAVAAAMSGPGLADAVDAAVGDILPAPPQGVPTDRQALVALIAVLIAAGGSLGTAIDRDEDVAAWVKHYGPSDTSPEPV